MGEGSTWVFATLEELVTHCQPLDIRSTASCACAVLVFPSFLTGTHKRCHAVDIVEGLVKTGISFISVIILERLSSFVRAGSDFVVITLGSFAYGFLFSFNQIKIFIESGEVESSA